MKTFHLFFCSWILEEISDSCLWRWLRSVFVLDLHYSHGSKRQENELTLTETQEFINRTIKKLVCTSCFQFLVLRFWAPLRASGNTLCKSTQIHLPMLCMEIWYTCQNLNVDSCYTKKKNWCAKEMDLLLFYVWPLLFLITLHLWHAHKVPEKCTVFVQMRYFPQLYIYLYMSSGYFTELDAMHYTLILW